MEFPNFALPNILGFLVAFLIQFVLGQLWFGILFRDLVKKFLIEQKRWPIDWRNFSMADAFVRTVVGNYVVILVISYLLPYLPAECWTDQLKYTSLLALLTAAVSLHHSGWEGRSLASIIFQESYHVLHFGVVPVAHFLVNQYLI